MRNKGPKHFTMTFGGLYIVHYSSVFLFGIVVAKHSRMQLGLACSSAILFISFTAVTVYLQ